MNRQTNRQNRSRDDTRTRAGGVSRVGPRALVASFTTAFGGTLIGSLLLAGYLIATDPTPATAGENAIAMLRAAGLGALGGLICGLAVMLPVTWGAMALHRVLRRSNTSARLLGAGASVLCWLAIVPIGTAAAGFGGETGWAYLEALPGLLAALLIAILLAPWVRRAALDRS